MQRFIPLLNSRHRVKFISNTLKLLLNFVFYPQKMYSGTFDAQGIDSQFIKSIKTEIINRRLLKLRNHHECCHFKK